MKKKILIPLCAILAAVFLIAGIYVAYVFVSYYRLEDNISLGVENNKDSALIVGETMTIVSFNVGFGAYSSDYSFFMDGGEYSRAFSRDAVEQNITASAEYLAALAPDFIFVQEVDIASSRSYQVDKKRLICSFLDEYAYLYAQNYDSPYLFYPITLPHGKSVSGIMTLSRFQIESATRRTLPVESGVMKLLDLDRCYSVTKIMTDTGKYLCLYNIHLSAYSSDGKIAERQLEVLFSDMSGEYAKGNYIVCGGDFNKDLLGNSSEIFGVSGEEFTWAQSFPFDMLPRGFALVAPFDEEKPVPSCRNADSEYAPGESFVITIDGFIVSANVEVISAEVEDLGFLNSDHNPVKMSFSLKP